MQRPTCTRFRVRSPSDAHIIFHAVSLGMLPIVSRRLDTEERRAIASGCVYVWEERGPNAEATGLGIERWTDSIRWGPSRVRDEFLFYHEKPQADVEMGSDSEPVSHPQPGPSRRFYRDKLIKQTYSVFADTPKGRRKWHLIAYFTHSSLSTLHTIDDIPELASLHVPLGKYKSARSSKGRLPRDIQVLDRYLLSEGPDGSLYPQPRYSPFPPKRSGILKYRTMRTPSPLDAINSSTTFDANRRNRRSRAPSGSPTEWEGLAPLSYLQNIPPLRRHPLDEKALMSFTLAFT